MIPGSWSGVVGPKRSPRSRRGGAPPACPAAPDKPWPGASRPPSAPTGGLEDVPLLTVGRWSRGGGLRSRTSPQMKDSRRQSSLWRDPRPEITRDHKSDANSKRLYSGTRVPGATQSLKKLKRLARPRAGAEGFYRVGQQEHEEGGFKLRATHGLQGSDWTIQMRPGSNSGQLVVFPRA